MKITYLQGNVENNWMYVLNPNQNQNVHKYSDVFIYIYIYIV